SPGQDQDQWRRERGVLRGLGGSGLERGGPSLHKRERRSQQRYLQARQLPPALPMTRTRGAPATARQDEPVSLDPCRSTAKWTARTFAPTEDGGKSCGRSASERPAVQIARFP